MRTDPMTMRADPMRTSFLLLTALCLSCAQPLTQIVLEVDSDIAEELIGPVLITVRGPSGETNVEYTANFAEPGGVTGFPITLSLVLADDAVGDAVSVVVQADDVDGQSVQASAETRFVADSTRSLRLRLDLECVNVLCDDGATCGIDGVCMSNEIDGESLPVFSE